MIPLHKDLKVDGISIRNYKLVYCESDDNKWEMKLFDPMRDGGVLLEEEDQLMVQVTNKE
jgi:hypothetical protein